MNHKVKREVAFDMLDKLITNCIDNKNCPSNSKVEDFHHYLIDISIETYCRERAYYYALDNIGRDDNDRYYMAAERINNVLTCPNVKNSTLASVAFINFINDTLNKEKISFGIRKRKAYWTFQKYHPDNDSTTDFEGSCGFYEKFHKNFYAFYKNGNGKKKNLFEINEQIRNNWHIANGIELFQSCIVRKSLAMFS